MMFIDENTPRADLEAVIVNEAAIYARFDEARLLNGEYTNAEYREVITAWIEEGDECAAA